MLSSFDTLNKNQPSRQNLRGRRILTRLGKKTVYALDGTLEKIKEVWS